MRLLSILCTVAGKMTVTNTTLLGSIRLDKLKYVYNEELILVKDEYKELSSVSIISRISTFKYLFLDNILHIFSFFTNDYARIAQLYK